MSILDAARVERAGLVRDAVAQAVLAPATRFVVSRFVVGRRVARKPRHPVAEQLDRRGAPQLALRLGRPSYDGPASPRGPVGAALEDRQR